MAAEKIQLKSLLKCHRGRDFLIYCPGKNITEWKEEVDNLVKEKNLISIGCNKLSGLFVPYYHIFTNNEKYEHYGSTIHKTSTLMLGNYIKPKFIKKHKHTGYIQIDYTDRDKSEPISYKRKEDLIRGYYRTSGNIGIMVAHLLGANRIYVAGMCGFTYKFDGDIHYYKAELNRDRKSKKEWLNKYDKPASKCLDNLRAYGIDFKIITPTIYDKHYDGSVLDG